MPKKPSAGPWRSESGQGRGRLSQYNVLSDYGLHVRSKGTLSYVHASLSMICRSTCIGSSDRPNKVIARMPFRSTAFVRPVQLVAESTSSATPSPGSFCDNTSAEVPVDGSKTAKVR